MPDTKISWAGKTWNPITGCSKISPGCDNCYAERMAKRLAGRCGYPKDEPFAVTFHPDKLNEPLKWKKPRRVFVCSMGDLFHEKVWKLKEFSCSPRGDAFFSIYNVMLQAHQHKYFLLTKRPDAMKEVFSLLVERYGVLKKNVWLGVTAENQQMADERIPILLSIPSAKHFVSIEPILGPVDLVKIHIPEAPHQLIPKGVPLYLNALDGNYKRGKHLLTDRSNDDEPKLNWVICGGETGPSARPVNPDWVRSLRDQCVEYSVPFHFKSWGDDRFRKLQQFCDITREKWAEDYSREIDDVLWDQFPEVS